MKVLSNYPMVLCMYFHEAMKEDIIPSTTATKKLYTRLSPKNI